VELKFDINYYENSEGYSRTWLFYMDPIIEYATNTRSVVELTYSSIEGTKMIKVDGHSIPVPSDSEKLLEEKYGASWKTPDKDWIYWKSPAARPLDGFGEFY
jgi:hypothetical protein